MPSTGPAAPPPGGTRLGLGFVVGLAVVFVVLLLGGVALRAGSTDEPSWYGTELQPSRPRPEFALRDTQGRAFDFATETSGQMTVLFYGYANCPDICPITLSTLAEAKDELSGVAVDVVFVTVDPARDTPDLLDRYLGTFDPDFVGLTGSLDEIDDALEAAGLPPAMPEQPDGDGSYEVGHTSRVLLITPDDQVHLMYPFGVRQDQWVQELQAASNNEAWQ